MTTAIIRAEFEKSIGYSSLPESSRAAYEATAWPIWCLAWCRMRTSVAAELRDKVEGLLVVSEYECHHLAKEGHSSSARILQRENTLMREYLTSFDS